MSGRMINILAFNPYSIPLGIATLLCIALIIRVQRKKPSNSTAFLTVLIILVGIWCASYALELCFVSAHYKLIAIKFQYIAIPSLPPLFALFIFCYAQRKANRAMRRKLLAAVLVVPCIATLLMLTNDWHHIMYTGYTLTHVQDAAYTFLFPQYGVGFIVSTAYSYILVALAFIYIFYLSIKTTRLFSAQAILLLGCALIPITANLINFRHDSVVNFDMTPIALSLSGALIICLTTRMTLLSLQPLARNIIVEHAPSGIILLDSDKTVVDLNPAAETIFDIKKTDVLGRKSHTLLGALPPLDDLKGPDSTAEFKRNGRIYALSVLPARNSNNVCTGHILTVHDVTDKKSAENHIAQLAYTDSLTHLPNYTHMLIDLQNLVQGAPQHGHQIIVLHIHIKNVNYINSSYGHDTGDALIKRVAEMIQPSIWDTDVFARTKGANLIVAMPVFGDARLAAKLFAAKVLRIFTYPVTVRGNSIFASIEIGICISPEDGNDAKALVQKASLALEQAKASHRHYAFYSPEKEDEIARRNILVGALRSSLLENRFTLEYQPQYDFETQSLYGVEALLRWEHPTLGNVPPSRFIYLLEDSGLIVPVGNWTIQESARQYRVWREMGLNIPKYSINLSVKQFSSDHLVPHILNTLDKEGIPRYCLEVEVTETLAALADKRVVDQIGELSDAGVRIAIDDFGAGFSSLTYFKYLNVNTLKIDQEISADIHTNKYSQAIFESLKLMCDKLGVDIITEYVDKDAQIRKLTQLGCRYFQGFYFSKPLPPAAFEDFVRTLSSNRMLIG